MKSVLVKSKNKKQVKKTVKNTFPLGILSDKSIEYFPFFVILIDRKRIVRGINRVLPGYSRHKVIGTLSDYFIAREYRALHAKKINTAFKNKKPQHFMVYGDSIGGNKSWYETHIIPVIENKKVTGAYVVSKDISAEKNNEERFKTLSEAAFEGIAFSENGKIIDANEQFAKIHKYKNAKEIIGLNIINDFVIPEMQKDAEKYITGRKKGKYEIITKAKNGSKIFLESKTMEIKLRRRKIGVTVAYDITNRKSSEIALLESERTLSTLMNNLPGMAYRCLYDDNWTMLFVSSGCKKLTGYKEAEIIHNKKIAFANLVLQDDKEVGKAEIENAIKNRTHFEIQYRIIDKNRKVKWIWEKGEGVYDQKGKLLFIEGFITDITERKEQEKTLNQSRELYQNLVEQSPQGTFIHDQKGRILYANNATLEIINIKTLSSIKNHSMFDWILPEFHEQIKKDKDSLMRGKTVNFKLSKIRTTTGAIIDVEYRPIAFMYNGEPAVLVVFHDISIERKLNEERLRAKIAETANIQLQNEIIERKNAEEKVRHSLKEKEILLNEVHHRVKNNLQVISSILNLQSSYVNEKHIQNVLRESQNRIKSMAFIHESLYQTKDFSGIKFSDYIINLSNNLVHTYISGGESVRLNLEIEEVFLNLDLAIPCGLILNELVSNALKYAFPTKSEGNLSISLKQFNDIIEIKVSDNGQGLPDGIDYKNTQSLGLQLVMTLVDQLSGEIKLNNTNGACFTITFNQNKSQSIVK